MLINCNQVHSVGGNMKLLIDGTETTYDLRGANTVEEAFTSFKEVIAQDRIIVEILIDGKELNKDNESDFLNSEIAAIDEVAIKTDSPFELAKTNIKEADEYLDSFKTQIDDVIEVLQSGGEEETYDIFVDGLKGLEDVLYLVDVVKQMLTLKSEDLVVEEQNLDDFIDAFTGSLAEFKTALEDEDLVYLQDLLQYELKPALDALKGYLAVILDKLA